MEYPTIKSRPNPKNVAEQQEVEHLEEIMVSLNIVKLRLLYAIDALKEIEEWCEEVPTLELHLRNVLGETMQAKLKAYERLKILAYDGKENEK